MLKKISTLYLVILTALFLTGCGVNNIPTYDEAVTAAWSQVQNQYKRRADLVPNLVNTVKGYAAHEEEVLIEVVEARSKVSQMQLPADVLNNPEAFRAFQQNQDALSSALSRLLVVVERYPDLKASQNFLSLQSQLEGTENRITVERRKFNESARNYNTYIKLFPKNMLANMFGFEKKPYFEAQEGADQAPKVEF